MLLKRKRSLSELVPSLPSTTSSASSPSSWTGSPQKDTVTRYDITPHASMFGPVHLNSRTTKRTRSTRTSTPAEEVHQRTLDLLFSAQQRLHHDSDPMQSPSPEEQPAESPETNMNNQTSLHQFWKTKSKPSPAAASLPSLGTSCHGSGLEQVDGHGMMMMMVDDDKSW